MKYGIAAVCILLVPITLLLIFINFISIIEDHGFAVAIKDTIDSVLLWVIAACLTIRTTEKIE